VNPPDSGDLRAYPAPGTGLAEYLVRKGDPVLRLGRAIWAVTTLLATVAPAGADTLFWEDFDGYTSFPAQDPIGDPVNPGVPLQSEGADEVWYGARFEAADSYCYPMGSVDCDLAVQKVGNLTTNPTPVGRFEDDAGILFSVDTSGYQDVTLEFDWRTFSATSGDMLVVGYFLGDIPEAAFTADMTADFRTGPYNWTNWVELDRQNAHSTFSHETWALPDDVGPVWVAFWLDDGEGDYGKVDDVHVSATLIPEPATALLLALGLAALSAGRRARRTSC
jgi:hypothetical protein